MRSDAIIIPKDEFIKIYNEFKTVKNTAKYFNCSEGTIRKNIKYHNMKLHLKMWERLDHDFFAKETADAFYWAGFIAADGCVTYPKKKGASPILGIKLTRKDENHLYKFKKIINAENKIYQYKTKNKFKSKKQQFLYNSGLHICSKRIVKDLEKFNITPRKTATYEFPEWLINHPLVSHFMRGYFDGDGCITLRRKFSIAGNEKFLETCKTILINKIKIKNNKIYKYKNSKSLYSLWYSDKNSLINIFNFLYDNANVYLDRKFIIYCNVMRSYHT